VTTTASSSGGLGLSNHEQTETIGWPEDKNGRRKVLIATLKYPPGEPIEVIVFGSPYLIDVEKHVLNTIAYFIQDPPVPCAQTKTDRNWISTSTYHGFLTPIYPFPEALSVCLSLRNPEFQGPWSLRTKEGMKEVHTASNTTARHCTKYAQFGNTFNVFHAATSFISFHQNTIGVAGVSDKRGKRS
jgi:alpha-1,3-glucan synthase